MPDVAHMLERHVIYLQAGVLQHTDVKSSFTKVPGAIELHRQLHDGSGVPLPKAKESDAAIYKTDTVMIQVMTFCHHFNICSCTMQTLMLIWPKVIFVTFCLWQYVGSGQAQCITCSV